LEKLPPEDTAALGVWCLESGAFDMYRISGAHQYDDGISTIDSTEDAQVETGPTLAKFLASNA